MIRQTKCCLNFCHAYVSIDINNFFIICERMLLYCKISIEKVEKWMSECKLLNGKLKFKNTAHL